MMISLRKDTASGIIERSKHPAEDTVVCTFNEWWNGDGIDFVFEGKTPRRIELSFDEINMLVAVAGALEYIDKPQVREDIKKLRESWEQIQRFRNDYSGDYDEYIV